MKKLLFAAMVLIALARPAGILAEPFPSPAQATERILALQEYYPDGSLWNGLDASGGMSGIDFLFVISDAVFGSQAARAEKPLAFESLLPGDILRFAKNAHSVMIVDKLEDHVTVVEVSVNRRGESRVYWGRTLSKNAVEAGSGIITRYPGEDAVLGYTPGDVNGDGRVDGRDVLRLACYAAGLDVKIILQAADVTGDGCADGRDVLRLARYAAGQDVELQFFPSP